MNGSPTSIILELGEAVLCLIALASIFTRRQAREYRFLCLFLASRFFFSATLLPLVIFAGHGIDRHFAYPAYFYSYWASYAIDSTLCLLVIYNVFHLAMAPLDGLRKLGMLVFRWAVCISIAIALGAAFAPHISKTRFIIAMITEMQRTQSILTLCLLLFVCFAVRPMGLSFKSRIFGVSLGLGIMASYSLFASAWMTHFHAVFSVINTANGVVSSIVMLLWTSYFVLPEPKRRIIVLPTTSPFLRWNQISQALGDHPGFVAVGGIPPELFAPAELEVMRRASLKMADQPMTGIEQSQSA